jgi:hypothetical protein
MRRIALICVAVLAVGCRSLPQPGARPATTDLRAAAADASVALLLERQARLLDVASRIRAAAGPLCADQSGPLLGIAVWRASPLLDPEVRQSWARRFDGGPALRVTVVQAGSAAQFAGVRVGDGVERVDGHAVRTPADVFDRARASRPGPIRLQLSRSGSPVDASVERVEACRPEIFLEIGDLMLSDRSGDDDGYVTSGFVRFAHSDDELALVVAHEIAHRLLGPVVMQGSEIETRADQIGMYLAARAGFDTAVAPAFWDRVAIAQPWSLSNEVEHYGWSRVPPHGYMPARAVAVRKLAKQIREKRSRGEALLPD